MDTGEPMGATQLLSFVQASIGEFVRTLPVAAKDLLQTQAFASGLTSFLISLAEVNRTMNLTSDANPRHLLATHVRDSLAPLLAGMDAPVSLLDIGTGGGFPAVPLALAWPQSQITMSESIGKKARFLQSLVDGIPLGHARVIRGRVEDPAAHLPQHAFNMITARGVAHIAAVLQYALPLLAADGRLVLWKGQRDLDELDDPPFVAALQRLHCIATVVSYALPDIERNSKLVILQVTPAISGRPHGRNGL